MTATVNFFSKVVVDDNGKLEYVRKHSQPGAYVDLRFEIRCGGFGAPLRGQIHWAESGV